MMGGMGRSGATLMMNDPLSRFNNVVEEKLGFTLRKYQEVVASEIVESVRKGCKFIIVSMPTGSGKTLVEMFTAFYGLESGVPRILVLEPTRFLCDQMYSGASGSSGGGLWRIVFGDAVGREYEGDCSSFLEPGKKIIISTPQTGLKCVSMFRRDFRMVIIDEVHHAFGGRYYSELLMNLKPDIIVGFTALLPSYKKYRLDPRVESITGEPYLLTYDFKKLKEIDQGYNPPKAIADMFDSEMNDLENKVYEKLFRSLISGEPRIIKFLELTLARYGKEAFCESYKRALDKGKIIRSNDLDSLCGSKSYSHKARTLIDILTVYDAWENNKLKPILIYTSRKPTAYEFEKAIIQHRKTLPLRVAVLTSDMKKEERRKLMDKAKSGNIDIIISTLVGEEGIDIPEAGLLVMTDTPKNPLRFYQRIGRLIRGSRRQEKIKYLIITLTPKTIEYGDLEEALWNLCFREGVDLSYVVINIEKKTLSGRVLDIINRFSKIYHNISIPYTLLAFGQELSDPLNYIFNLVKSRKEYVDKIKKALEWRMRVESDEDLDEAIFTILTFYMIRSDDVKEIFKPIDKTVNKSTFSKSFNQAIREGKIFYIYNVEAVAEIINRRLQKLYKDYISGGKKYAHDKFFRIDRKSILRLFTEAFPYNNINHIIDKLSGRRKKHEEYLDRMVKSKLLEKPHIWVDMGKYNQKNKSLSPQVIISLSLNNIWIELNTLINYYDLSEKLYGDKAVKELIEENLYAIGYEAVRKFIDWYIEEEISGVVDEG